MRVNTFIVFNISIKNCAKIRYFLQIRKKKCNFAAKL